MFQKKITELFSGMLSVFVIVDDILIASFDEGGRDHHVTLEKVLRICRKAYLKVNKDKCLCRCTSIPFLSEISSWQGVSLYLWKVKALMDMPAPKRISYFWSYSSSHQ